MFKPTTATFRLMIVWLAANLTATATAVGQEPVAALGNRTRPVTSAETELPYNQQPIDYLRSKPTDRISALQAELESGTVTLKDDGESGVLRDLLRVLEIPVSSQLLVFSKSSANARLIKPQTPRAIYFNDASYVAWVPSSQALELSSVDPNLGGVFYNLSRAPDGKSVIRRDESCLLCHLSRSTLRVPGHLVRSFITDSLGELRTGWSRVTHETPYEKRWAGWYVTGQLASVPHLGNVFGKSPAAVETRSAETQLPVSCEQSRYLTSSSDILPHLVLDHQAHGHNLITRLNYEVRLGKSVTALEPLIRYLLFLDEPPLPGPLVGNAEYRIWFEQQGRLDPSGRSLRQLDLEKRLFKYRLSYLIYSNAFDALPQMTRLDIFRSIKEVLTDTKTLVGGDQLSNDEREAILAIVRATKSELPEGW